MDVPNASVMVVEHAERFGLAQLHQLRGRVGRGAAQSYCVLLFDRPLSDEARERLKAMTDTTDGFVIAERDLAIRGPGDMFGTRQAGLPTLRIGDLAPRPGPHGGRPRDRARRWSQHVPTTRCRGGWRARPGPGASTWRRSADARHRGCAARGGCCGRRHGTGLRPTSDRLRETLFNILAPRIEGARVLDVCAGTGAVGIEALSRGAAAVTFVEDDRRALALIEANLRQCQVSEGYTIDRRSALARAAVFAGGPFDIVFLDPPYAQRTLEPWLHAGGLACGARRARRRSSMRRAWRRPRRRGLTC